MKKSAITPCGLNQILIFYSYAGCKTSALLTSNDTTIPKTMCPIILPIIKCIIHPIKMGNPIKSESISAEFILGMSITGAINMIIVMAAVPKIPPKSGYLVFVFIVVIYFKIEKRG